MTLDELPSTSTATGIRLAIRLTPRASRTGVDGIVRDAGGGASLERPRSGIRILTGDRSRQKLLEIDGDPATLQRLLAGLLPQAKP